MSERDEHPAVGFHAPRPVQRRTDDERIYNLGVDMATALQMLRELTGDHADNRRRIELLDAPRTGRVSVLEENWVKLRTTLVLIAAVPSVLSAIYLLLNIVKLLVPGARI